jgi:hypothetical protein
VQYTYIEQAWGSSQLCQAARTHDYGPQFVGSIPLEPHYFSRSGGPLRLRRRFFSGYLIISSLPETKHLITPIDTIQVFCWPSFVNRTIRPGANPKMARGWESKSVEQQQADMAEPGSRAHQRLSFAQQKLNRQRDGLLLSRTRLGQQLQAAAHPRHRQMLERAIAGIYKQLSYFEQLTGTATLK